MLICELETPSIRGKTEHDAVKAGVILEGAQDKIPGPST